MNKTHVPRTQGDLEDLEEARVAVTQKKAKILVAEDDITNREVTLAVLENLGMLADGVTNGEEALQALRSLHYDLVLMDCQMPGIDGFAATRLIRDTSSQVQNHSIPVIAMTAHSDVSGQAQCLACGMNDFLAKPLLPGPLKEKLQRWLPRVEHEAQQSRFTPEDKYENKRQAINSLPVWDQDGMHSRLMGDTHVAFIISQGFLHDMPQQILKLEDYYHKGDMLGLRRQAHTIKGASAVVGGSRLCALAQHIEKLTQTDSAALGPAVERVAQEFACLEQEMSRRSKI